MLLTLHGNIDNQVHTLVAVQADLVILNLEGDQDPRAPGDVTNFDVQAYLVLLTLHAYLENHVHTLVAVQAHLVLLTLHGDLDNQVHTLDAVQA